MAMQPSTTVIILVAITAATVALVGGVAPDVVEWHSRVWIFQLAYNLFFVDVDLKIESDTTKCE